MGRTPADPTLQSEPGMRPELRSWFPIYRSYFLFLFFTLHFLAHSTKLKDTLQGIIQ